MNDLTLFQNNEFKVRAIEIDGEPWFVAREIAEQLGYGTTSSSASNAVSRHVDTDDKGVTEIMTPGGKQKTTIINESGMYSLVLSSKIPSAKRFKKWVTSEVLPSIRKHGAYMTPEVLEKTITDPVFVKGLIENLISEREAKEKERQEKLKLAEVNKVQAQQIVEMKPKVSYYDKVMQCKDLMTITMIAKDFGMTAAEMNQVLHQKKVQYKQSGQWFLYSKYQDKGYCSSKTNVYETVSGFGVRTHTYWTQKGRLFIYNLLKEDGILPLIERTDIPA